MRIGILSLNPGHNYGGILQSLALQITLEGMGHEVSVICKDVYLRKPGLLHFYKYLSRLVRFFRNRSSWKNTIFPEFVINQRTKYYRRNSEQFMRHYLNCHVIDSFSDIKESDFDCIVVGSDQVWRPLYFEKQYLQAIDNAFLSFTEGWNIKRVVYAASFGTDEWEYSQQQTVLCAKYLQSFDVVSLREDSGVELCSKYFAICAQKVVDPTLLLTAEDYIRKIDLSKTPESPGTLLVYVLDPSNELEKLVKIVSDDKELIPFKTGKYTDLANPHKNFLPPVEEWLQGFVDAEFVITDSFHACVFSLIFHKPFLVIGNKERGMTRFVSFLEQFNMQDRMLFDANEYLTLDSIDFAYADEILTRLKYEGLKVLQEI